MQYFVTGATGFIGRFLVAELLKRPKTRVFALVRPGSEAKLDSIRTALDVAPSRLVAVGGNLEQPALGLATVDIKRLSGKIDHFFHLAALYDLRAEAAPQHKANVEGTAHALDAAVALKAGCFHHVSSIAAGGTYPGRFTETMFDEACGLEDPYFFTKHESEKRVRQETRLPWRVYRPSLVVGDSRTGEMDKVDGPYYLFPHLEKIGHWLPEWLPLPIIEGGRFNIVPVDYVARALDHIAHQPGRDGQCFHLTAEQDYTLAELLDLLAGAAGAPRFRLCLRNESVPARQRTWAKNLLQAGPVKNLAHRLMDALALPPSTLGFLSFPTTYDRRQAEAALAGTDIQPPAFDTYLNTLWRYWQQHLNN